MDLRKMAEWIPDAAGFFYPRRCPVCQEAVEQQGSRICGICRTKLSYVRQPFCQKCGKPLLLEEQEYCRDCRRKRHRFERGRAPLVYDRIMKSSIAAFKYGGRREYAAFYAEEILRRCAKDMSGWQGEVFVPIPLHPSRRRKRGFNQAELLTRVKKTKAQKELNDQERLTNLKDAFSVRKGSVPYQNIILVDDIYTTGSTVDAAADALKEKGARKVYFVCICVGNGN